MKTFIFSTKFLILSLAVLPLSLCSKEDDNSPEQVKVFEPVTIDLSEVIVTIDDTTFSVDGFSFDTFRVNSSEGGGDGLWIASPENGNPSMLELDLNHVEGLSKISLNIHDNGGGTVVSLWNEGVLIEENSNIPGGTLQNIFTDIDFPLNNRQVDLLRVTSLEALVKSIKLE